MGWGPGASTGTTHIPGLYSSSTTDCHRPVRETSKGWTLLVPLDPTPGDLFLFEDLSCRRSGRGRGGRKRSVSEVLRCFWDNYRPLLRSTRPMEGVTSRPTTSGPWGVCRKVSLFRGYPPDPGWGSASQVVFPRLTDDLSRVGVPGVPTPSPSTPPVPLLVSPPSVCFPIRLSTSSRDCPSPFSLPSRSVRLRLPPLPLTTWGRGRRRPKTDLPPPSTTGTPTPCPSAPSDVSSLVPPPPSSSSSTGSTRSSLVHSVADVPVPTTSG